MSIESLIEQIKSKIAMAPPINAKIKIDFSDQGCIFIDGTQSPPVISEADEDADTVFICKKETFEKILNGSQDPTMAYMMGKLKIKGSMGLAMKLNSILED
ncbi:MAG: SCP2 sterol-binding domain-containing protein [Alphaproteobacteria bacterium]